jgi:hypothetical protein
MCHNLKVRHEKDGIVNEREKELKRKYGTSDVKRILRIIDRRVGGGPFSLAEIGLHDDGGSPALSHVEDADMVVESEEA